MSIFPAMSTEAGQCMAFPDVCKTPSPGGPVPIPYPNIANCADGQGAEKVKIRGSAALRKGDKILRSSGDQPGSLMGVVSNTVMGPAVVKAGDSKVKVENKNLAHLTVPVGQNGNNANAPLGLQVVQSQTQVKVLGAPPPRRLTPFEVPLWINDVLLDVREMLECSPTLVQQLTQLNTWEIKYGEKGCMSCAERKSKTIILNPERAADVADLFATLAHEVGHALYSGPTYRQSSGMDKRTYVESNVKECLRDEGAATLNNAVVKQEVEQNCPEAPIPMLGDDSSHNLERIARDPDLSEAQKRDAIAACFARLQPEGANVSYAQYYANPYIQQWAKMGWGAVIP